jgi:anhydro-N-acetylmuramic acid kinase
MHQTYRLLGLMSGTSLDGLDLAYCEFRESGGSWEYSIGAAETVPYAPEWKQRLASLERGTAFDFVSADTEYGHLLGHRCLEFIKKHNLEPLFIASHGHTIFHQPASGITSQIGSGAAIAAEAGLPVVCDFRSLDVALGGQGAPLVPIGDELLFTDYDFCLNLGGFANISTRIEGRRIAFDICPVNIVMNALAAKVGLEYDRNGEMASTGKVDQPLLNRLNALPYYSMKAPKSLGKEWTITNIWPLLDASGLPVADLLATCCEHAAIQIGRACEADSANPGTLLVTGGGALNTHLIERIRVHAQPRIVIPEPAVIHYKEALVFAFLGLLRWLDRSNCLASVTGANHDNPGGAIYSSHPLIPSHPH